MMMVVVSYDVATAHPLGQKRLRRVAKICESYGQRVQNSVFECVLDPDQWTHLRLRLLETIDGEKDSLRFYFLGKNWRRRVEHVGAKETMDLEEPLIL